jgi:hypothetical protein
LLKSSTATLEPDGMSVAAATEGVNALVAAAMDNEKNN